MSESTYITIFYDEIGLKNHEKYINNAYDVFEELYADNELYLKIARIIKNKLIERKFFAFINHSENYKEEFKAVFEFAKLLAYAFNDWVIVRVSTSLEELEGEEYLISRKYGLIKLKEDKNFQKEIKYLFTKAEFLKAKRKLEELEKERDG